MATENSYRNAFRRGELRDRLTEREIQHIAGYERLREINDRGRIGQPLNSRGVDIVAERAAQLRSGRVYGSQGFSVTTDPADAGDIGASDRNVLLSNHRAIQRQITRLNEQGLQAPPELLTALNVSSSGLKDPGVVLTVPKGPKDSSGVSLPGSAGKGSVSLPGGGKQGAITLPAAGQSAYPSAVSGSSVSALPTVDAEGNTAIPVNTRPAATAIAPVAVPPVVEAPFVGPVKRRTGILQDGEDLGYSPDGGMLFAKPKDMSQDAVNSRAAGYLAGVGGGSSAEELVNNMPAYALAYAAAQDPNILAPGEARGPNGTKFNAEQYVAALEARERLRLSARRGAATPAGGIIL